MKRVFNFSAGPAVLPEEVLKQAQEELLNWHDTGMSIMEISHRSKDFIQVAEETEKDLREVMSIPSQYKVLFLPGGGRGQFCAIPMNLLRGKSSADYACTGIWSEIAIQEAKKYSNINIAVDATSSQFTTIPEKTHWHLDPDAAYFHYVDNETVHGVEFSYVPETDVPLVADMSSNILSKPIDVTQFGLIYAGTQKNMGPAGLAVVIVHEDLIGQSLPITLGIFDYKVQAERSSMYNTPTTFTWYLTGLVIKWIKNQGGLKKIGEINARKAKKLYECIDQSDLYYNKINPEFRSRMNVIFNLTNEELTEKFIEEAEKVGLCHLRGHKYFGGVRASIYNAMPEKGVDTLIDFMKSFEKSH